MNPKITILIVVILIVMVMFGRNPVEEARKAEEEKYKGINDPLIRAITEYHEESDPLKNGRGNGLDESGRRQKAMPAYMYSNGKYNAARPTPRPATGQQPTQRNNGYYPPAPLPNNNTGSQPSGQGGVFQPQSELHMYLNGGQRLAFAGTNVYYLDANGKEQPLPDGKYTTANGLEMLIADGKKVLGAN